MDTGLTTRPTDGAAQAGYVRPSPAPVQQAVATDVSPSQAVAAASSVVPGRNDQRSRAPAQAAQPATRVDIEFDKKTHQTIYRIVDTQTGHVIVQIPDHTDFTV